MPVLSLLPNQAYVRAGKRWRRLGPLRVSQHNQSADDDVDTMLLQLSGTARLSHDKNQTDL